MFGKVLLRSEFVLQHFGEITHVLTRCRLRERQRQKNFIAACASVCVDAFFMLSHMHLWGRECVLLIRYHVKVFLLQEQFLPCKQTTNYHSSLTRGQENPFAFRQPPLNIHTNTQTNIPLPFDKDAIEFPRLID